MGCVAQGRYSLFADNLPTTLAHSHAMAAAAVGGGTPATTTTPRWEDLTLRAVLQDRTLLEQLREYTGKEHNGENVEFLVDVFAYQLLSAAEPVDEARLRAMGTDIVREYVDEGSPSQVNLSCRAQAVVIDRVKKAGGGGESDPLPPSTTLFPGLFDTAKREVYNLLNEDIFPRFLQWLVSRAAPATTPRKEAGTLGPVPVTTSSKAVRTLGESVVRGTKAYKVLGDGMSMEALNEMAAGREKELRARRRKSVSEKERVLAQRRPSAQQVNLQLARRLSYKALALAGAFDGEEVLLEQSQYVVPSPSKSNKAAEILGESIVRGPKAYKILGDNMTAAEVKGMVDAQRAEHAQLRRKSVSERNRILQIKHLTEEQTSVPLKKRLSQKALSTAGAFAGDGDGEALLKQSQAVVETPTSNPKVVQMMGEAAVAGRKALQLLGDSMSQEQFKTMQRREAKEKQKRPRKYAVNG